jgi:hypothetical protein
MLLYYGNAGILIFNPKNRLNRIDFEYSETEKTGIEAIKSKPATRADFSILVPGTGIVRL